MGEKVGIKYITLLGGYVQMENVVKGILSFIEWSLLIEILFRAIFSPTPVYIVVLDIPEFGPLSDI